MRLLLFLLNHFGLTTQAKVISIYKETEPGQGPPDLSASDEY